jgi:hypothetical protein
MGEDIDDVQTILLASSGWNLSLQDDLFLSIVHRRVELVFE